MPDILQRLRSAYIANPAAALDLLPNLFQAADAGRIVELPCTIGKTLWWFDSDGKLDRGNVVWFETDDDEWTVVAQNPPKGPVFFGFEDFGREVFLTREAAEAEIKERQP